jgi:DNA-binding Xre family transcriptional regulator
MTTVEKLKKMLDWIYSNTETHNQTGVARKVGMHPVTMSKIHNGKTKSVKQETLRAVNAAFGNVFNPEWIRGESDVMLLADVPSAQIDAETLPAVDSMARVLIESLKRELAGKEETIAVLRSQLSDKDDVIATKDKLIDTLQQQIDDLRMQAAIEKGLHTPGRSRSAAADHETAHP